MKKGGRLSPNKIAYILLGVGTMLLISASYVSVQRISDSGLLAAILTLIGGALLVISFWLAQKE